MTSQTFNLELIPQGVPPIVHVSQYDKGQTWLIDVTENGIPFTIPSGTSVAIQGTKPDNTGFQYAGTYSGTQVEFTVEQQMTVLAGELDCELVLVNGEEQVATINFILAVEPAALDDETIISETELPLIEQAAELGAVINAYATQIHADATTAANAATSATASQTAAAASEATATAAADDATASKTAAATSASNAATSETNAAGSATDAAGSASAAAQSATSAAASAAAAQAAIATDMTGATANDDGTHGLVPQPLAGDESKFLRGDGTWAALTDKVNKSDITPINVTGVSNNTGATILEGETFYNNGAITKATADIASGATISQSNAEAVSSGTANMLIARQHSGTVNENGFITGGVPSVSGYRAIAATSLTSGIVMQLAYETTSINIQCRTWGHNYPDTTLTGTNVSVLILFVKS